MPTFKIQCSDWEETGDGDDVKSRYVPTTHTVVADGMEVLERGALCFFRGDALVRIFASGEWEQAWEEGEA